MPVICLNSLRMKLLVMLLMTCAIAQAEIYEVTAYCGCAKCCGKAGQPTASGKMPVQGVTVAAPRAIKLGTKVLIEGVGERIVQDRLAKRYDHRIDVFFNSHKEALKFGKRKLNVTIK